MTPLLFGIIWYILGVAGGVICSYFDWSEHGSDVTTSTVLACILSGVGGPIMLVGAMIYTSSGLVIIKGRKK